MKLVPWLYVAGTVAAAAASIYVAHRIIKSGGAIGDAVGDAVNAVNPLSETNIAKRAVDAVVQRATGEPEATLGGKIWEWLHPNEAAAQARISDPVQIRRPGAGGTLAAGDAPAVQDFGNDAFLAVEDLNGLVPNTPFWYGAP